MVKRSLSADKIHENAWESFQLWKSLNLLFEMFEKQSFAFCIKNLPLESQAGPFLKELNDFPINHHFPYFSSRSWRLSLCSFFHKAFEIFNLDGVGKPLPASKWRSCDLTFPQWCAKVWNGYLWSSSQVVISKLNQNGLKMIIHQTKLIYLVLIGSEIHMYMFFSKRRTWIVFSVS